MVDAFNQSDGVCCFQSLHRPVTLLETGRVDASRVKRGTENLVLRRPPGTVSREGSLLLFPPTPCHAEKEPQRQRQQEDNTAFVVVGVAAHGTLAGTLPIDTVDRHDEVANAGGHTADVVEVEIAFHERHILEQGL
jgi:hypothetical protein